jgi:metal-dependent HD superfamily phosphatase/phosphodiesterase
MTHASPPSTGTPPVGSWQEVWLITLPALALVMALVGWSIHRDMHSTIRPGLGARSPQPLEARK